MKNLRYYFSLLAVMFLVAGTSVAQDLISAKELAGKLKDNNVIIISAQKPAKYNTVHIKGSVNMPPAKLVNNEPVKYMNKSPEEMAKILGTAGIDSNKELVLYDNGSSKYSGRLYWVLKYLGAKDVKILDGELPAWKAARKPITKTPTKLPPATFRVNLQPEYLATMDEVMKATSNGAYVIVDARSPAEYSGTDEDSELRRGHIPGAVNIEFKEMLDTNGKLKRKDELRKIFESKGVTPDKTVIVYCATSVRAGIEFMALHSIMGYSKVKLFDGAFTQWQSVPTNKVIVTAN